MLEINENGRRNWLNDAGRLHRTDGPACEYADGDKAWFRHGKLRKATHTMGRSEEEKWR